MNSKELLQLHRDTSDKCFAIMQKKNNDYSGGEKSPDALANFKMSESLGLHPVMGLLLRMQDKIMRIKTFASDGTLKVSDETTEDAFDDIVNYAILGKALLIDERRSAAGEMPVDDAAGEFGGSECSADSPCIFCQTEAENKAKASIPSDCSFFGTSDAFAEFVANCLIPISVNDLEGDVRICTVDGMNFVALKKGSMLHEIAIFSELDATFSELDMN